MESRHEVGMVLFKDEAKTVWYESERGHNADQQGAQHGPLTLTHLELDIFPIRVEGMAKAACRYYTDIYAPTTFRRLQIQGVAEDGPLLRHYIPLILSHHVSFVAMLANSTLQFDLMDRERDGPSPRAKALYDTSIRLLRQYLQSTADKVSDLVICTMMFLATFDKLTSNHDSAWIHLQAIREAIDRRGGPKQMAFDGWLATVTDSFVSHAECQRAVCRQLGGKAYTAKHLRRPVHPFPPALCAKISRLPQGFEDFCISERPVAAVIDIILVITAWLDSVRAAVSRGEESYLLASRGLVEANLTNATRCMELLQHPHLPLHDQFVLMALQAYCSLMDWSERGRFLNMAYLQVHTGLLPSSPCFLDTSYPRRYQAEWLTWVGMTMLASSHTNDLTWSLGTRILGKQEVERSWMERIRICERFFWNERLSYQVLRKMHFKSRKGA
ncbi:hypothetical protein Z517_03323 [Fonsecaea pedrosoi CBS 271.37]|uniref:Transcription factor domain-containing protein n=1 Tax=Fonsecaea pedrosoi CBS 271.37 TaxID=1442368 RepID=A0A0D2FBS6_9EURO|nr:uncharacterized protein Z517_03323 [Fonsecaea pedrosoi CBS 271.37]KIW84077.1 hypothetical protein Z517_03323 [Fonsecaea pedrosoi CBS 271.37]